MRFSLLSIPLLSILMSAALSAAPTPVPVTADLVSVLASAKTGQTIQLAAGQYLITGPAAINANNLRLLGAPAGVTRIVRKSVPGTTTGILLAGDNIEVAGIVFDSDKAIGKPGIPGWNAKVSVNALRVTGKDAYIHGCTARNVDDFVFLAQTSAGARVLNNQSTTELRGDAIYLESCQGALIQGNTIPMSNNEHGIRIDGVNATSPSRFITIAGNDIGNTDGKESIAIRQGWNILVENNTLRAWARLSQGIAADGKANACCGNCTFSNNHFTLGAWLTLNPYTPGTIVKNNTFVLDAAHTAVAIQGPQASADIYDNIKAPTAPGLKLKPLIHKFVPEPIVLSGNNAEDAE